MPRGVPSLRWHEINLLGIDVGYSKKKKSTGIATYISGELRTERIGSHPIDRQSLLDSSRRFALVAVDGPIVPENTENFFVKRKCEYSFIGGAFEKRCKAGLSHCGSAIEFRLAAGKVASEITSVTDSEILRFAGPFVRERAPVVEAFPNGFLGVLLGDRSYDDIPNLKRGRRFDELYSRAVTASVFARLMSDLRWKAPEVLRQLNNETDHEKRAALICLLTAAYAASGRARFVGDDIGGWFVLPDEKLWAQWARNSLASRTSALLNRLPD